VARFAPIADVTDEDWHFRVRNEARPRLLRAARRGRTGAAWRRVDITTRVDLGMSSLPGVAGNFAQAR